MLLVLSANTEIRLHPRYRAFTLHDQCLITGEDIESIIDEFISSDFMRQIQSVAVTQCDLGRLTAVYVRTCTNEVLYAETFKESTVRQEPG